MNRTLFIALLLAALVAPRMTAQTKQSVVREFYLSGTTGEQVESWTVTTNGETRAPSISRTPAGKRVLGPFNAPDELTMQLAALPPHTVLTIRIGWHIIGPWMGRDGNDRFLVAIDKRSVINGLFSNTPSYQTWPDTTNTRTLPSRTRARNVNMLGYECSLGADYTGPMDATYETEISISHTGSDGLLSISAIIGDTMVDDCSKRWALDHIEVFVSQGATESALPHPTIRQPPIDAASYDGEDIRAVGEYTHDGHFPRIASNSALARSLHMTFVRSECNRCGDACLWYTYTLYTDGWVNVWSNKSPSGQATFSFQLTTTELNDLFPVIVDAVREPLLPAYHDEAYEEAHIDLTHCQLNIYLHGVEHQTEVWAAEPPPVRTLMDTMMNILAKRGWAPMPP